MECLACLSISGQKRISPGPIIHEGTFWLVEHAYPSKLPGWLVIVLKRHAAALHELTAEEWGELGDLQKRTISLLHAFFHCEKEYVMCLAEGQGFNHIHFHMVPRLSDLPEESRGAAIFSMLKDKNRAVPPEEIKKLCEQLKKSF